ncbi:MAG: AAC(3) family N-acetyltransferase, partial [Flavobacteriia bacterium]|nr:AAC(3) family N-acetyltransferase [Flavobacteriia bacterium]
GGKILYIGVTLANAGTSLHLLEDAVTQFKFPVYYPELFSVKVKLVTGELKTVQTKVHNPEWSAKRRCDELIPLFEQKGAFQKVMIGNAPTLLVDAQRMLEVMISEYEQRGVTMYTPNGSV